MSALEELWHLLQGRSSRTETGPDTVDTTRPRQQAGEINVGETRADTDARIQRNWRYRAGPWQMK